MADHRCRQRRKKTLFSTTGSLFCCSNLAPSPLSDCSEKIMFASFSSHEKLQELTVWETWAFSFIMNTNAVYTVNHLQGRTVFFCSWTIGPWKCIRDNFYVSMFQLVLIWETPRLLLHSFIVCCRVKLNVLALLSRCQSNQVYWYCLGEHNA